MNGERILLKKRSEKENERTIDYHRTFQFNTGREKSVI